MKILLAFTLICLFLSGCIEPLPVHSVSGEPTLVVDGMITDQPGPYAVSISLSTGISDDPDEPTMIKNASVWITDEEGNAFLLQQTQAGVYASDPDELRGQIGKTYSLRIIMADGSEYRSSEETLMPAGNIDTLYGVFEENVINQTDITLPQDVITFFVSGQSDPQSPQGLLRWRSTTIYEIVTYPQLKTKIMNDTVIPDPMPCSGFIYREGVLVSVGDCQCCNCWVYNYPRNAVVSPARFSHENQFRDIAIAQVPVDSWRFYHKFYIEVEQLSTSALAYEFWKRVSAQQQGTRSLFQPNAIKVNGNIRSVSDPDKEVFGIFSASAVTRRSIFITRGSLPKQIVEPDKIPFDCRYVIDNAVNVKPPFW